MTELPTTQQDQQLRQPTNPSHTPSNLCELALSDYRGSIGTMQYVTVQCPGWVR
jgi:hypothetical protein